MLFSYKVKTNTGEVVTGTLESADRYTLSRELRSRGQTPLAIEEKKKMSLNLDSLLSFMNRVKTSDLILFTKNLSGMIKAGLSLSRALAVLEKQTKNKKFHDIIIALDSEVNQGGTLSSGFGKFPTVFSKLFVSMTRAGEESGDLAGSLTEIGMNLDKAYALTR